MSEDDPTRPPGKNLQITIDEDVAQGIYTNFQVLGSNETEFVLDFAYVQPHKPVGKIRSRVIMSPKHAKALVQLLAERVRDHEARFGPIAAPRPVFGPPGGSGLPN